MICAIAARGMDAPIGEQFGEIIRTEGGLQGAFAMTHKLIEIVCPGLAEGIRGARHHVLTGRDLPTVRLVPVGDVPHRLSFRRRGSPLIPPDRVAMAQALALLLWQCGAPCLDGRAGFR